jgi:hypothetical protein
MPRGFQFSPVDPGNQNELPLNADAGTKIQFLNIDDGRMYTRDDAGIDELLGAGGAGGDWTLSAIITQASGIYTPPVNELVQCNPVGVGGCQIRLPDPSGLGGKKIAIKNVTNIEDPGQPFGSDDIINITTLAGNIDGLANGTMTTLREFKVFVSNDVDTWMQVS